jgi:hypothetical protein
MKKQISPRQLQAAVQQFNEKFPVGTPVLYYPVIGGEKFIETKTREKAFVLSDHTACVFVENISGCVALDAVEINRPRDAA